MAMMAHRCQLTIRLGWTVVVLAEDKAFAKGGGYIGSMPAEVMPPEPTGRRPELDYVLLGMLECQVFRRWQFSV